MSRWQRKPLFRGNKSEVTLLKTSSEEANSVIVVSDFRPVPIATCVALARKRDSAVFLVSQESLSRSDFGDGTPQRMKILIIRFLNLLYPVEVVPSFNPEKTLDFTVGIKSSMISITRDRKAKAEKYPDIFQHLVALETGAHMLLSRIRQLAPTHCYLFNGRLASVQVIAAGLHDDAGEVKISIYEWGGSRRGTFQLCSYPLHSNLGVAAEIVGWALERNFRFSGWQARKFIQGKLNSQYARSTRAEPKEKYATVIFAGSPHEHAAIDFDTWSSDKSTLDGSTVELLRVALRLADLPQPIAFRMHPNVTKDPSCAEQVRELELVCQDHGVSLIPPTSRISSHALIEGAQTVVVGNSSIGLDALFLNKHPLIIGHPSYKDLLHEVTVAFPGDRENPERVAGLLASFRNPREQRFLGVARFVWMGLRLIEIFRLALAPKANPGT